MSPECSVARTLPTTGVVTLVFDETASNGIVGSLHTPLSSASLRRRNPPPFWLIRSTSSTLSFVVRSLPLALEASAAGSTSDAAASAASAEETGPYGSALASPGLDSGGG